MINNAEFHGLWPMVVTASVLFIIWVCIRVTEINTAWKHDFCSTCGKLIDSPKCCANLKSKGQS